MRACANLRCWLLSQWKSPKWHPVRPPCLGTLRYESVWSLHLFLKHQQKKIFILFYLNSVTKPQGHVSQVQIPKVLTSKKAHMILFLVLKSVLKHKIVWLDGKKIDKRNWSLPCLTNLHSSLFLFYEFLQDWTQWMFSLVQKSCSNLQWSNGELSLLTAKRHNKSSPVQLCMQCQKGSVPRC